MRSRACSPAGGEYGRLAPGIVRGPGHEVERGDGGEFRAATAANASETVAVTVQENTRRNRSDPAGWSVV